MISIEAWRSSIGVHHNCKINNINRASKCLNTLNAASLSLSCLLFTVLSASVIGTLLRIGCIEANPGPTGGGNEGKVQTHFQICHDFHKTYFCIINNYIHVNTYTVSYLGERKWATRIMVAGTGVVIAGGLSALLVNNNNWNPVSFSRMGIVGASLLGAAIPLWIAGMCGSGNCTYSISPYRRIAFYIHFTSNFSTTLY